MPQSAYHTTEKNPAATAWRELRIDLVYEGDPPYWLATARRLTGHGTGSTPTAALFSLLRDLDERHRTFNKAVRAGKAAPGIARQMQDLNAVLGDWPHD